MHCTTQNMRSKIAASKLAIDSTLSASKFTVTLQHASFASIDAKSYLQTTKTVIG